MRNDGSLDLSRWLWLPVVVLGCLLVVLLVVSLRPQTVSAPAVRQTVPDTTSKRPASAPSEDRGQSRSSQGESRYSPPADSTGLTGLQDTLSRDLAQRPGRFAVAVYDFSSRAQATVNAHEVQHAASLIKLPIMMAVFAMIDSGTATLGQTVEIRSDYRSVADGSTFHVEPIAALPAHPSLNRLLNAMITVSDNIAANALIEFVGIPRIERFLSDHGYLETHVRRFLMDEKALARGIENTMSAYDAMLMLRDLELGRYFSAESRAEMLRLLKAQTHNEKIPSVLPPGVTVAHKTGKITNVEHDAGIVYLPDGRKYVLALLSSRLPGNNAGVSAAQAVSRLVYRHFAGK